jgi:hypothetical protein
MKAESGDITEQRIKNLAWLIARGQWIRKPNYEAENMLHDLFEIEKIGADEWREFCEDCEGSGKALVVDGEGNRDQVDCVICGGKGYQWTDKEQKT